MAHHTRLAGITTAACLALAATGARAAAAQEASQPLFKSETHLIDFTFSVRKPDGTLVSGLTRDDFQITEDGVPQKIAFFGTQGDLPLSLGLIVDASDSQSKFFKRHRNDIERFLKTVLRPQDEVFAICFGNHLRLTSGLTSSTSAVMDGLERFDKGDRHFPELAAVDDREGGTALYDAIYHSIQDELGNAQGRQRALILFTDGEENSSAHDLLDAIDAARENDTLIYAIRYTEQKDQRKPDARHGIAALHHLAAETGGADFDALHGDVGEAFVQIAQQLRSLYSVAYHSTNSKRDGTFRRVVITTADPTYTVQARTGYYAH